MTPDFETFDELPDGAAFDFVVVGSGFGGSVSALRLAEKGYSVAVLEAGRHFKEDEFPKSNWDLPRYLWFPRLLWFGLQRLTLLKDVLILSGAGVGGGSLVYATTLLEPAAAFYASEPARRLAPDMRERLKPHFETARRMLGVARTPKLFKADAVLREIAAEGGRESSFSATDVGVFFGEPGKTVADPYFAGEGPERAGCVFCGGCMVGCRHNAKNTLTKNYLPLALRRGARVFSRSSVTRIEELRGGEDGFALSVKRSGWGRKAKRVTGRRLVLSAGVLGTLRLLLEPANMLTRLPPRVGRDVRTNSEVILCATARRDDVDWSQGNAITSGAWVDDETHVEIVRYSEGSDAMNLIAARSSGTGPLWRRLLWLARNFVLHPLDSWRLRPFGWARRSTILLCMQAADSRLRVRLKSGFFGRRLITELEAGSSAPPKTVPAAEKTLARFAELVDAVPQESLASGLLDVSTTAHILGGAAMGSGPDNGVTGLDGKVFGYETLWVLDGSVVPSNLGVNPSLTITALSEHAMSLVPPKA